jgi:hypothetical protein
MAVKLECKEIYEDVAVSIEDAEDALGLRPLLTLAIEERSYFLFRNVAQWRWHFPNDSTKARREKNSTAPKNCLFQRTCLANFFMPATQP